MEKNIFTEEEATKTRKMDLKRQKPTTTTTTEGPQRTLKEQEYILYIYIQYIFMQITGTGKYLFTRYEYLLRIHVSKVLSLSRRGEGGGSCRPGGYVG